MEIQGNNTEEYLGINKLLHSALATDWQLQLWVKGRLSELKQGLQESYGYAVSNGSYWDKAGATAWIIIGKNAMNHITGMVITPGRPSDHSSFCSKLAGIYGILLTFETGDP